jgi:hypothetical protein
MTDRINSLTVVLEHDIREDAVEPIVGAIKMIRHVQSVGLNVADLETHLAESRARDGWASLLYDFLYVATGNTESYSELREFLTKKLRESE